MGVQKKYRVRERAHSELLRDLMLARGVETEEAQEQFLSPDFERDSHDPMLLPGMEAAVDRIIAAQKNNESIAVWSDYDCDGIPGGVALVSFLRAIGLSVAHYIPHRHKEGYGLNEEGLSELASQGITLIITVDLGTTEHERILYAKQKGVDIIVTDHHEVSPTLPEALAVLNPKRKDSVYPFDGLCGAGVAWKLIQGVLSKNRFGLSEGQEKWFLDLIGMATLSDMVPLVGENRMLARYGLVVMRSPQLKARRPGLASLLDLLKIKQKTLTEDDIGFMVAPRINAASRMDNPETAARLLATMDVSEAGELARELNHINDERKGLVAATVKEVHKRMEDHPDVSVIVMGNPNWRPGILGLVANSLVEAHGKPVFLWGREGGEVIRGSVRGDGLVSVVDMMHGAKELFEHYGGHTASGGFSLSLERVHELAPRLESVYQALRSQVAAEKEIIIDRQLDLAELDFALRDLAQLAPFGVGNQKPLFIFPNAYVSRVKTFGKTNNHLELELKGQTTPFSVSGIAFFSTPESFTKQPAAGDRVDVVGHVELDWRGRPRVRVVDVI